MTSAIEVLPYDPQWRAKFDREAERVRSALGDAVSAIHPIGSTTIPDIDAKLIIMYW